MRRHAGGSSRICLWPEMSVEYVCPESFRAAQPGSAELSFPFRLFHFDHSSSRGQAFLKFATKRLLELAATIDMLNQVDILTCTNATWKDSINKITLEYRCERCRDEEMVYNDYPPQFCLELI